ncbi:MAG: alanine racemase [Ignavibacteriae bacterium]|nr:alanine racemase [Ignavibacteriota bacterium]
MKSLRNNFDGIKNRVGPDVKVLAVVKANAYGHGIVEISKVLQEFGIDYLGVAFLEEAIELRQRGIRVPLLVLSGVMGSQIEQFFENDLDISVASLEIAEQINQKASSLGRKAKVHLKIDTGMTRLGVRADNALPFIEKACRLNHLEVVGIYSHFATSDERDKSFAYEQLGRFNAVIEQVGKLGIDIPLKHIANSGAILDMPDSYFSMVRAGIMMYGIYPSRETSESILLQPVLSLKSRIGFIKEVPAHTSIGYNRKYFTSTKTHIATIPVGYADGYSRRLTNRTEILIGGKRYPVVGSICMDHIMADVGMDSTVRVGDDVVVLGTSGHDTISVWEIADKLGTNPYEVFTSITARVPRVVMN